MMALRGWAHRVRAAAPRIGVAQGHATTGSREELRRTMAQTSPKHPLHQRGNKSTVSRTGVSLRSIYEFEEPQLLGGKQQSGLMPAWFGAIEHQGFLSSQWDQRPLR